MVHRWLVTQSIPNNELGEDSGWTYAVVPVHPGNAAAFRDARNAFVAAHALHAVTDLSLVEMKFHFDDCRFVSGVKLAPAWRTQLEANGHILVEGATSPTCEEAAYPPYATYMLVDDEGLSWTALDKHTDNVVWTQKVPWGVVT